MEDFLNIRLQSVTSFISKRNSSKTTTARFWVLENIRRKRLSKTAIVCFSSTGSTSGDWDFLPKGSVRVFDETVLSSLCKFQMKRVQLYKRRAQRCG